MPPVVAERLEITWYDMWTQGFPEDERSAEGVVLAHTYHELMTSCRNGNMIGIVAMALLLPHPNEHMQVLASIVLAGNAFALWFNAFHIPHAEQCHGILYAHRFFVRINLINTLFIFCVAIPLSVRRWPSAPETDLHSSLGLSSPLLAFMLVGLLNIMICSLHLAMFPLKYRAAVHAAIALSMVTTPQYTQLGHVQEVVIGLLSLAFGELIGMTGQRLLRRSFAATQAAQDVHDACMQKLTSRLEQIDAEKERLTYELLLEKQRGAAASRATHAPRAGSSSSYGTDTELIPAADSITQREVAPAPADQSRWVRVPGSWGSGGRESSTGESEEEVSLSPGMRQRLNASLGWLEDSSAAGRDSTCEPECT
jgi:hypothetical protein